MSGVYLTLYTLNNLNYNFRLVKVRDFNLDNF